MMEQPDCSTKQSTELFFISNLNQIHLETVHHMGANALAAMCHQSISLASISHKHFFQCVSTNILALFDLHRRWLLDDHVTLIFIFLFFCKWLMNYRFFFNCLKVTASQILTSLRPAKSKSNGGRYFQNNSTVPRPALDKCTGFLF